MYNREYYLKNKEKLRKSIDLYREKNRESILEKNRVSNMTPEQIEERNRKQRERRAKMGEKAKEQYLKSYYKNRDKINAARRQKRLEMSKEN